MIVIAVTSFTASNQKYPFQDSNLEIEKRIDDLLKRLSLKEKASLMLYNNPSIEHLDIPAYNWWNESLHGIGRAGRATVFPQAIGLAATFDKNLLYRVADAISDEARAKHNVAIAKGSYLQYTGLTFWSPNVNIFRDPRWGRGQETYGEDPHLTSILGVAYVHGMQGNDPNHLKTSACAKHFAVHSGPEESRHYFNALPDKRELHEIYFPAFKALVDANVESVMCAYNQLNNEPCCGNQDLLQRTLREKWNFKGHIVSDCWAISDFVNFQKITENEVDAAVMAMKAGVNLNCGSYYNYIEEAVKQGKISEYEVDKLLRPVLRTRFKLGLFDTTPSSPYSQITEAVINSNEHQKLAYEAASKSIVLLKNDKQTLPINNEQIHKVFVTGPTASDNTVLLGNYNGFSGNLVTTLEGVINKVDAGTVVDYSMGTLMKTDSIFHGEFHASSSDLIIACIGNSRLLEGEAGDAMLSKHGGDRKEIKLPENQIELIRKLRKAAPDKKLVVVVNGGSAIALPEVSKLADAILFAWYPGEQGGNAIADIIFGNTNPSGKLPITFYNSISDLPPFDDYSFTNRTYQYFKGVPLYSFGHGLSYSTFKYQNLKGHIKDSIIELKLEISNSSEISGEETVQVYVSHDGLYENNPIKRLVAFERIHLQKGETKQVTFTIPLKDLKRWDNDTEDFTFKKGQYDFKIGSSSSDIRQKIQFSIN
jgi:beta-glucosidase